MPETTWTLYGITLPVTSWINIVIAAGTLGAALAALWTARIMWKSFLAQTRENCPYFVIRNNNEKMGKINIELVNFGGRAAEGIYIEYRLFRIDNGKAKQLSTEEFDFHGLVGPQKGITIQVGVHKPSNEEINSIKKNNPESLKPLYCVISIKYTDIGGTKETLEQTLYLVYFWWECNFRPVFSEEKKAIDQIILSKKPQ